MSSVFTDPERLRSFATVLAGYSENTAGSMERLQAQLQRLGQSWRDQEYDRFYHQFGQARAELAKLRAEIDALLPVLKSDADKAEEIHRR